MIAKPVSVVHDERHMSKIKDANGVTICIRLTQAEAAEIAQALNDGERYKKALNEILQIPSVIGCQPYLTMRKIAADALREGAGDEKGR